MTYAHNQDEGDGPTEAQFLHDEWEERQYQKDMDEQRSLIQPTLQIMPTKGTIALISDYLREIGESNPIETIIRLEALKQAFEQAREKLTELVVTELNKNGGRAAVLGAQLTTKETGVKYDYSKTPRWVEMKKREDAFADERKAFESSLKLVKSNAEITDTESGEVYQITPPIKTSKSSFEIRLAQ